MSQGQHNVKNLAYYRKLFAELNVSSSQKKGQAYYKPILLLSVIDLIAQGLVYENKITVSDDLINTFEKYWINLASGSYKGGLHYPFFHLQSEGFWHLEFKAQMKLQPKTLKKLKEIVDHASLDEELFDLLQDQFSRAELVDTLIAVWFSASRRELEDILSINTNFQKSITEEIEKFSDFLNRETPPKFIFKRSVVRNAFFRKAVVHIYDYRCAFCRVRVIKDISQNIVDGAHIKPFSRFYDSTIANGISLCKNHHWAFDQGWFAIDEDYKIRVSPNLLEDSANAKPMREFDREPIFLPALQLYFPKLEALQWHRLNVFRE